MQHRCIIINVSYTVITNEIFMSFGRICSCLTPCDTLYSFNMLLMMSGKFLNTSWGLQLASKNLSKWVTNTLRLNQHFNVSILKIIWKYLSFYPKDKLCKIKESSHKNFYSQNFSISKAIILIINISESSQ